MYSKTNVMLYLYISEWVFMGLGKRLFGTILFHELVMSGCKLDPWLQKQINLN